MPAGSIQISTHNYAFSLFKFFFIHFSTSLIYLFSLFDPSSPFSFILAALHLFPSLFLLCLFSFNLALKLRGDVLIQNSRGAYSPCPPWGICEVTSIGSLGRNTWWPL